jgi:antitoxin (DNA-binding transcriptional repressor) of toxin-antitoxin stability system
MAMTVSAREFLHKASSYLRRLRVGDCDRITVLYHGVPAIVVTPFRRGRRGGGRGRTAAP